MAETVRFDPALVAELTYIVEQVGKKAVAGFAEKVKDKMIENAPTPNSLGNKWGRFYDDQANLKETPWVRPNRQDKNGVLVDAGQWYARFVENGTSPHTVKGRHSPKKWMIFEEKRGWRGARRENGKLVMFIAKGSGQTLKNGEIADQNKYYVFSQQERHTGNKARLPIPYVRKTADQAEDLLEKFLSDFDM